MRLAAISIDLDDIPQYCAIHGLPTPSKELRFRLIERAVPRFEVLMERLGMRGTAFAIGSELKHAPCAEAVARLHKAGHEIGNHTHNHRYDLTRLPEAEIEDEIWRCSLAIEAVTGSRPRGFRAPGYTINDRVFDSLQALDLNYDSSVFPCPTYYAAKASAIGLGALQGRKSRSVLDDPRVLNLPADPYRIGRTFREKGRGILELPIGVTRTRTGRLPFIGTSLTMAGERGARLLTKGILGRPLVNLELHAIDFADMEADDLQFLSPFQPDLRLSRVRKLRCLEVAIDTLADAGYRFVTLCEATSHFGRMRDVA